MLLSPQELELCTLYTRAEPCCMCAGAVYWTQRKVRVLGPMLEGEAAEPHRGFWS